METKCPYTSANILSRATIW